MMPPPPPPPPPPHDPHFMEANGRYPAKPESPGFLVFMNTLNAITQLLIGAVAFSAFTYASLFGFSSSFTRHIYLCVIGYVILMSQAILSFNPYAGWAYSLNYTAKKFTHISMQIVGSVFAIVGSCIRIVDLDSHFNTAHGILGIIALLLTILSLFGGIVNFIFSQRGGGILLFKVIHSCLGATTLSVAFITLALGFGHNYYIIVLGYTNSNLAIVITIAALFGLLVTVFTKIIKSIGTH